MSILRSTLQTVLPSVSKGLTLLPSHQKSVSTSTTKDAFFKKQNEDKSAGHSSLLSDAAAVYELQVEDVKPREWDQYLQLKGSFLEMAREHPGVRRELVASWKFIYGDVNFRAMHLYRYPKGWTDIDDERNSIRNDVEYLKQRKAGYMIISRQTSEFLKSFSFWPEPVPRHGGNIYDVRTYTIRPGCMYDWANYWARGIRCRTNVRDDIPYGGFFTQLGRLHTIYHIWCYADLADRKKCREDTWTNDGWSDIVSNTVPLVTKMETRILEPLKFSPTQ